MYMLDTNICIYIRKTQPPEVLAHFRKATPGSLCMSAITFAELMHGASKSQAVAANLARLRVLRQQVPILPFDEPAAELYGAIRADLERRGELIGSNDLLISAHALSVGMILVTNNEKEFRRVQGLRVENWVSGAP
ncbi:Ribonuclease VapC2 [Gammaproteobacteria bacterium]